MEKRTKDVKYVVAGKEPGYLIQASDSGNGCLTKIIMPKSLEDANKLMESAARLFINTAVRIANTEFGCHSLCVHRRMVEMMIEIIQEEDPFEKEIQH